MPYCQPSVGGTFPRRYAILDYSPFCVCSILCAFLYNCEHHHRKEGEACPGSGLQSRLQRVAITDSDFLSVGFSLVAKPSVTYGRNPGATRGCLKAWGRDGKLPACPTSTVCALMTALSSSTGIFAQGLGSAAKVHRA